MADPILCENCQTPLPRSLITLPATPAALRRAADELERIEALPSPPEPVALPLPPPPPTYAPKPLFGA